MSHNVTERIHLDEAKESLIAELKSRGNAAFKAKSLMEADVLYSKVPSDCCFFCLLSD
jgi:hypothetical protein